MKILKGQALKLALKKMLGSAMAKGPKAWLIKFIFKNFWSELGEPLINEGVTYLGYVIDKKKGKTIIKKRDEAKDENDQAAFDSATDDIFK